MVSPLDPNLPYLPQGPDRVVYLEANRAPTILDTKYRDSTFYKNNTEWRNNATTPPEIWKLAKINSRVDATWFQITGSSGPMLSILPPLGLTPIIPDGVGSITFTSTGGTVAITGVTGPGTGDHTVNFDLTGGGIAVDQINVDANTAPGTDPVVPTAAGQITVTGAQVAAGTVGANVIRTDSLAANTYTIEVQRSAAVASTASANNGVCHFNSDDFDVDPNGFVSLIGATPFTWLVVTEVATPASLVNNVGYICASGGAPGALSFALPTTSALGDIIEITLDGATSWTITQGAGQQIRIGNVQTTAGAGGSLTSTLPGDTIRMVCQTANLKWNVISMIGNITVV